MEIKAPTADVGWIMGRFQVQDLHEAHIDLIESVKKRHSKVVISLGIAPINDEIDPLDFEARKQMINEKFPEIIVVPQKDCKDDHVWSKKLDQLISTIVNPNQTVILYGSRDSFIKSYHGCHQCIELVQTHWISGTSLREYAKNKVIPDSKFRAGAIWNSWQKFACAYPTVDIAVVDINTNKILLGRKEDEVGWRFIGGFADPKDPSFEAAAQRELHEELPDIEAETITKDHYYGSFLIEDWRYRRRRSKVKTLFYIVKYVFGAATPGDDIFETQWFNIFDDSLRAKMVEGHVVLYDKLMETLSLQLKEKESR